jgi:hypothetical protein
VKSDRGWFAIAGGGIVFAFAGAGLGAGNGKVQAFAGGVRRGVEGERHL